MYRVLTQPVASYRFTLTMPTCIMDVTVKKRPFGLDALRILVGLWAIVSREDARDKTLWSFWSTVALGRCF